MIADQKLESIGNISRDNIFQQNNVLRKIYSQTVITLTTRWILVLQNFLKSIEAIIVIRLEGCKILYNSRQ